MGADRVSLNFLSRDEGPALTDWLTSEILQVSAACAVLSEKLIAFMQTGDGEGKDVLDVYLRY